MSDLKKVELSLEEQLQAKREQEKKEFQEGYQELCEKFGYILEPEYRFTPRGSFPELSIQPTR